MQNLFTTEDCLKFFFVFFLAQNVNDIWLWKAKYRETGSLMYNLNKMKNSRSNEVARIENHNSCDKREVKSEDKTKNFTTIFKAIFKYTSNWLFITWLGAWQHLKEKLRKHSLLFWSIGSFVTTMY